MMELDDDGAKHMEVTGRGVYRSYRLLGIHSTAPAVSAVSALLYRRWSNYKRMQPHTFAHMMRLLHGRPNDG